MHFIILIMIFLTSFSYSLMSLELENDSKEMKVILEYDPQSRSLFIINKQDETRSHELFFEDVYAEDESSRVTSLIKSSSFCNQIGYGILSLLSSLHNSAHHATEKWRSEINIPSTISERIKKMNQDLIGEANHFLMGGSLYIPSHIANYGNCEISDRVRITFINGILNTKETLEDTLSLISSTHGNANVHYVFRSSGGWMQDVTQAIIIKTAYGLGFRSHQARLLAKLWKDLIREMGGVEEGGVIVHYAHSLGGSDTDRARDLLSPEEQKMIRVVTFGTSTLIHNEGFQSAINVISSNDGICFFWEPMAGIYSDFDPNVVLSYCLDPKASSWPSDHLLSGVTYASVIRDLGNHFKNEFQEGKFSKY